MLEVAATARLHRRQRDPSRPARIERWGVDEAHIREYLRHRGRRTWSSDEDLEAAVAASTTYREVRERLGLKGASSHTDVRVRIAELGLDDEHLRVASRAQRTATARTRRSRAPVSLDDVAVDARRRWDDDDLRAAVRAATSLHQVFGHLGLAIGGSQWQVVRERISQLELDTSHFAQAQRPGRSRSWTDDQLREAVARSRSVAAVLRALGIAGGGAQQTVVSRIRDLGLPTDHMRGQGWSRGTTVPRRYRRSLDEILVENSTFRDTKHLKRRLVSEGILSWRCEQCGLVEWKGGPITLQLDHINGDRRDNRVENLRLLCPNCHTQTDTYCGKNIGRYDR